MMAVNTFRRKKMNVSVKNKENTTVQIRFVLKTDATSNSPLSIAMRVPAVRVYVEKFNEDAP